MTPFKHSVKKQKKKIDHQFRVSFLLFIFHFGCALRTFLKLDSSILSIRLNYLCIDIFLFVVLSVFLSFSFCWIRNIKIGASKQHIYIFMFCLEFQQPWSMKPKYILSSDRNHYKDFFSLISFLSPYAHTINSNFMCTMSHHSHHREVTFILCHRCFAIDCIFAGLEK